MASFCIIFLFLSISFLGEGEPQNKPSKIVSLGSSLSPLTHPSSWSSSSGHFAFGFYQQGNGFAIGIWLHGVDQNTTIWTANPDNPSVPSSSELVFKDSKLVLLRGQDTLENNVVIIAIGTKPASTASMTDSGNFVLYDEHHHIIWQSFDYPTDTILGGQVVPTGGQLLSRTTEIDQSTRKFRFKMQNDGNLVLYPADSADWGIDAYWSSGTVNDGINKGQLYLDSSGNLVIINNTKTSEVVKYLYPTDGGPVNKSINNVIYRLTLEANGMLKLYSHDYDDKGIIHEVNLMWSPLRSACDVHGFCGLNSYCTFYDDQPNCNCIPGSNFADVTRTTLGCLRNFTEPACKDGKKNAGFYSITKMKNMMWGEQFLEVSEMSVEDCGKSCLEDCNCGAALFKNGQCNKQTLPLRYVRRVLNQDQGTTSIAFFKLLNDTSIKRSNWSNPPIKDTITNKNLLVQVLVIALSCFVFSCISLGISAYYILKIRVLRYKRLNDFGKLGLLSDHDQDLTLSVFSYSELKRATKGFKDELGKGSFGAVYRGVLNKGRKTVAVKRLEKLIEEGEREFQAEMRAIGRTNHKNLVRLLGYCSEGSKRLLVYEYMRNGSLADYLFNKENGVRPNWNERARIAIEVAKGILYLHEECKNPIIHCDIKPSNILMDDFYTAKISDFGLAKLLMPDQTRTFTQVRGTRGYLAPEWTKNDPISVKADVYSYGIVLLEIACCRRNFEIENLSDPDEIVLSYWVYKCFAARELNKLMAGEEVDTKSFENMVKVGLWCIQDEPYLRPSMKSVVLMLEGITDICSPPCPQSTSM